MNLVIDIGNTAVKSAIFRQNEMIVSGQWKHPADLLEDWKEMLKGVHNAILSSVRKDDGGISGILENSGIRALTLNEDTPLPIENRYRSTSTLGKDRIAAAVGASIAFPGKNLLVIDTGTAITIDLVTADNEYLGGNISPGMGMRYRALHAFTDNLPLLEPDENYLPMGEDTGSAIRSGVQQGIIFELEGYINRQKNRYPDLQVVITGGDALFFDKKLKNSIFVDLNLNLRGLNRILDYNVGD